LNGSTWSAPFAVPWRCTPCSRTIYRHTIHCASFLSQSTNLRTHGQLSKELRIRRPESKVLFVSGYAGKTLTDHKVVDLDMALAKTLHPETTMWQGPHHVEPTAVAHDVVIHRFFGNTILGRGHERTRLPALPRRPIRVNLVAAGEQVSTGGCMERAPLPANSNHNHESRRGHESRRAELPC
jgi:hypothetical protein